MNRNLSVLKSDLMGTRLTIDSCQCPVGVQRSFRQFKDKGPSVGTDVRVTGSDVDAVGHRLLTHLYFRGKHMGSVVVNVQQVDLERPRPTGSRITCKHRAKTVRNAILAGYQRIHQRIIRL